MTGHRTNRVQNIYFKLDHYRTYIIMHSADHTIRI